MALNKNRVFSKVLFSLGWLIFAVHAHSGTICVGPCPQPPPTIVEDRQYQYSGYLSDLTVSSSQQLPVSLTQFYNLLGVNTGAAVPVSLSFTVERVSGQYMTSFGYHYLAFFGSVSPPIACFSRLHCDTNFSAIDYLFTFIGITHLTQITT